MKDKALLSCVGIMALALIALVLEGLVLALLWGWFVVPLGLPPIGIAHALGISTIASAMLSGVQTEKYEDKSAVAVGAVVIGKRLFVLAIGYIVHLFMG